MPRNSDDSENDNDNISENGSDNNDKFNLKRRHSKVVEFMPLSNGNLFENDADNCEYDWGFKNVAKKSKTDAKSNDVKNKNDDNYYDSIMRKDVYRVDDPTKLNEEDKEIFFENLDKIYKKNLVYIPSFYEIDNVVPNVNEMIQVAIRETLEKEANRLNEIFNSFWTPLHAKYVLTGRLSKDCSAYKIILKGIEQYPKAVRVLQGCLTDFAANAANYVEVIQTWKEKGVDHLTSVFKQAVGDVLLKYADEVNMPLEVMATETSAVVFMGMVMDDVATVKKRVEKMKKVKKAVVESESDRDDGDYDDENDVKVDNDGAKLENRPVTTAMMKNKGIVPKRKKTNKNPRLKHRMKFKKAVVRHHSQVPRERKDAGNYQGEASGIRIGVIKARKFK